MDRVRELIEKALADGYLMHLGTVDEGGPWVAGVIYVHDDALNLYWISSVKTRHSQAVHASGQAAAAITVSDQPGTEFGLQVMGTAKRIPGARLDLAIKHWSKRGKPAPKVKDILYADHAWYQLTPTKIELIYQPEFDFDKQVLEL
ncbi:pyridoxamine 5'-phosphate oxidase family protein [Candidatus Berkelbacteria bacterium]|nr:pyridoxamine 5'-phosphate oxidase family protein [Candidatus Berkelbacteria bacterium]